MDADTLSYAVPGYRTRKSGRIPALAGALALGLAVGLAGGWTAHAVTNPEPSSGLPAPTTPETSPPGAPATDVPAENSRLREGSDYALSRTANGSITRWDCQKSITVALAGPVPDGAAELLASAVTTLATHSNLPLRAGTDIDTANDAPGTITVRYVSELPQTRTPEAIGLGGTSHTLSGAVHKGNVWLLNTSPHNTPSTPRARTILLHELMHALGADHAAPGTPELMTPESTDASPTDPGPGDITALNALGCPRS